MPVRKRCRCRNQSACNHGYYFDVMVDGTRHRMPVDQFARLHGHAGRVRDKREAERAWEAEFIRVVREDRNPRKRPMPTVPAAGDMTVADFLDRYETGYVKAEKLRSEASVVSRIKQLKAGLGEFPVAVLNRTNEIQAFKADMLKQRTLATVNRALAVLRHAINWGRFQMPPILSANPFHRFGVTIRTKNEVKRDRRLRAGEEHQLLNTALTRMNSPEHAYVGPALHDRIIGAIETLARQGEMLKVQNRHVDWDTHQIAIPGAHAKDAENRRIPFDPNGRLAPILTRRKDLGPSAFVFGSPAGEYRPWIRSAWETLLLLANGFDAKRTKEGRGRVQRDPLKQVDLHWHDLRHEGACRLYADGLDIRTIQLMLGHSTLQQTQRYLNVTDEELRKKMEVVWERRRLKSA